MDFRYARRVYLSGDPYDPEQSINMEMTTEDKNEWQHPEELKFDRELNFGDFFVGRILSLSPRAMYGFLVVEN